LSAYNQINKEFGSMMTTLLPEAEAKLVPVNPDDLSDGLNVINVLNPRVQRIDCIFTFYLHLRRSMFALVEVGKSLCLS
jgi:hypothetical protein